MSPKRIVKKLIPKTVFKYISPYGHLIGAVAAQVRAGFPAKDLKVIGVTGTDGKTTTCMLITTMLRSSGKKVAMITTAAVDYGDGRGQQPNPTQLTTGSSAQLNNLISTIKQSGVQWLVLEVSSHALDQRRVWGIPFSVVVMTNMSPEHLDYHGTFDRYRRAKQRLFKLCNNNKKGLQTGIVNADDKTASYFTGLVKNKMTYGLRRGSLKAVDSIVNLDSTSFTATVGQEHYKIKSSLVGEFNIYNLLATVAVGCTIGLDRQQIEQGIRGLSHVPGRMMPIKHGQNFTLLIDYAVTPAAIENVLSTTRKLAGSGKLHIVFGATGDRDKSKRPKMGAVSAKLADYVYLTDDETYTEDAATIRQAVLAGVRARDRHKVQVFDDRGEAIKNAIAATKKDDVVIIAGIGHQTSRNMGGKQLDWSDIEFATNLLKARK